MGDFSYMPLLVNPLAKKHSLLDGDALERCSGKSSSSNSSSSKTSTMGAVNDGVVAGQTVRHAECTPAVHYLACTCALLDAGPNMDSDGGSLGFHFS